LAIESTVSQKKKNTPKANGNESGHRPASIGLPARGSDRMNLPTLSHVKSGVPVARTASEVTVNQHASL